MKISSNSIFLLVAFLLLSSCSARQNKQLRQHQLLLSDYAGGNMPTEEKIDALATSFVKLMNQSLSIVNPKKGIVYVKKYGQQNEAAIDQILEEVSDWQSQMNTLEKINYLASMVQKPYTQELMELGPKFQAKYRQVKFLMNLTDKLKQLVSLKN